MNDEIEDEVYEPLTIRLWTYPDSYMGPTFYDYYVVCTQHRDSDVLTRSNFRSILKALGGEAEGQVEVISAGHWAVGWVEYILVHRECQTLVKEADELMSALSDYPVVDDEDFSDLEQEDLRDAVETEFLHRINTEAPEDWMYQIMSDMPDLNPDDFDYASVEAELKTRGWLEVEE